MLFWRRHSMNGDIHELEDERTRFIELQAYRDALTTLLFATLLTAFIPPLCIQIGAIPLNDSSQVIWVYISLLILAWFLTGIVLWVSQRMRGGFLGRKRFRQNFAGFALVEALLSLVAFGLGLFSIIPQEIAFFFFGSVCIDLLLFGMTYLRFGKNHV